MNSFIAWIGGKKALRQQITALFPESFDCYVEVFGGAGWVLFYKDCHAKKEVFNDLNSELINLYRCIKYHPEELQKQFEWNLLSRELFNQCRDMSLEHLTDIQRAARYFFLIKESFGSKMTSFRTGAFDLQKSIDYLLEVQKRLKNVLIENLDFERLIQIYDRENTLFYLDPPYYGTERYYEEKFSAGDHERLKSCLDTVNGKFILSYNDCPYIRALYRDYDLREVSRMNSLSSENRTGYKELLIKNY